MGVCGHNKTECARRGELDTSVDACKHTEPAEDTRVIWGESSTACFSAVMPPYISDGASCGDGGGKRALGASCAAASQEHMASNFASSRVVAQGGGWAEGTTLFCPTRPLAVRETDMKEGPLTWVGDVELKGGAC